MVAPNHNPPPTTPTTKPAGGDARAIRDPALIRVSPKLCIPLATSPFTKLSTVSTAPSNVPIPENIGLALINILFLGKKPKDLNSSILAAYLPIFRQSSYNPITSLALSTASQASNPVFKNDGLC